MGGGSGARPPGSAWGGDRSPPEASVPSLGGQDGTPGNRPASLATQPSTGSRWGLRPDRLITECSDTPVCRNQQPNICHLSSNESPAPTPSSFPPAGTTPGSLAGVGAGPQNPPVATLITPGLFLGEVGGQCCSRKPLSLQSLPVLRTCPQWWGSCLCPIPLTQLPGAPHGPGSTLPPPHPKTPALEGGCTTLPHRWGGSVPPRAGCEGKCCASKIGGAAAEQPPNLLEPPPQERNTFEAKAAQAPVMRNNMKYHLSP